MVETTFVAPLHHRTYGGFVPGCARRSGGWSLLECLAGLAVSAIVLAAAVPSVSGALAVVRLRAGVVQLGAALERVRAGALAEGCSFELRVVGPDAFELGPVDGWTVRERLPRGVVFAAVTSGGSARVSRSGVAENATFTISLGDRERRVTLNQRGRISVD